MYNNPRHDRDGPMVGARWWLQERCSPTVVSFVATAFRNALRVVPPPPPPPSSSARSSPSIHATNSLSLHASSSSSPSHTVRRRPVQAREVRGLARRLVGSTDLLGQVFRWEGEDYLVNDIAPGPTQSGEWAMKAYACCVKRRVALAGPLSEHNSAFV